MPPLFSLHIPSSRGTVPTGYDVLPDQNGWSRYLHFEAAWVLVLTGLLYVAVGLWNRHFRNNLFPARNQRNWRAFRDVIAKYLRRAPYKEFEESEESAESGANAYNVIQRTAYLAVIFVLFPLVIWTGLAMSPAVDSAFPFLVNVLGGRQSARTLHFFVSGMLLLFVLTHVAMVIHAGFWSRMRAMTIPAGAQPPRHPVQGAAAVISEQP